MIKSYRRKGSPLPCPLLKQRKKDRPQPCGIRDGKKSDPGSGVNIPDPQHCLPLAKTEKKGSKGVTVSTYVMCTVRFKQLFLIIWPLFYHCSFGALSCLVCQKAQKVLFFIFNFLSVRCYPLLTPNYMFFMSGVTPNTIL
jgi:hypothetical protein